MHRWPCSSPQRYSRGGSLFSSLVLVLSTCGGQPGVLVDIGSWPDHATSLRVDGALNGTPFVAPLSFPGGTTRFVINLPEGNSGQLSLALAALDGNDCPRATANPQVKVGSGLRRIAEANVTMIPTEPPYCQTPSLDSVTPPFGKNTAMTPLLLTGKNFAVGASVTVGGVVCSNASVVSSTQITCKLPARPATCGPQPVVVTNPDQQIASKAGGFSYFTSVFALKAATPATQAVQNAPRSAAAGDFNDDAKMDLVVANQNSNSFSLLLGNGDGSFQAAANLATGQGPNDIGAADFNGDAKLDVVVANIGDGTLSLYLGNSDGTFQPMTTVNTTGPSPIALAIGDFNGDTLSDVVVGSSAAAKLYVLLGNGDGTFQTVKQNAVMGLPLGVAIADVNGDQKSDLIASAFDKNQVSVLLGNGDGTFQTATSAGATCSQPIGVACIDVTGDAKPDIVVACSGAGIADNIGLLPGIGDGSFHPQQLFTAGDSPQSVWLGDANGDGQMDAIVTNLYSTNVSYLPGLGSLGFGSAVSTPIGVAPEDVIVTDLNNDLLPDVVSVNTGGTTLSVFLQQCK